jgi:putative ABC transport system permease protein
MNRRMGGGRAGTDALSVRGPGEVVVDGRTGAHVGERVTVGDRAFTVVGTTRGVHVLAGKGLAWTTVGDAQSLLFAGAPVVTAFLYHGHPRSAPAGTTLIDHAAAKADLLRLMRPVMKSIETFRLLMWVVAAAVVGSVLYLTAVDRVRDYAVLKATGARNRELALSLLVQAAALAVVASTAGTACAPWPTRWSTWEPAIP